jgi:hypothetical protein
MRHPHCICFLLIILISSIHLHPAYGQAAAKNFCAPDNISTPLVRVQIYTKKPKILWASNKEMNSKSPNSTFNVQGFFMGFYTLATQLEEPILYKQTRGQNTISCLHLRKLSITIQSTNAAIYINERHKKNRCAYRVTLAHEMQHYRNMYDSMNTYGEKIEETLRKQFREKELFIGSDPDALQQRISHKIRQTVNHHLKIYERVRALRDQRLDSPANYRRTEGLCPNW